MEAVSARLSTVVVAALLLLSLAACRTAETSGAPLTPVGQPTQPTGSGTPGGPVPSSTASINRMDVLTVYRGWWKALQEAFARGDAEYADLAVYGVDPILTRQRNTIRGLRAQGIVQRTQLSLQPRILHQGDIVAEIADCVRGPAGTYYDVATGKPRAPRGYRNEVPTKDSLLVSLHKRGGYWFVVAATNEGVQPC